MSRTGTSISINLESYRGEKGKLNDDVKFKNETYWFSIHIPLPHALIITHTISKGYILRWGMVRYLKSSLALDQAQHETMSVCLPRSNLLILNLILVFFSNLNFKLLY